MNYKPIQRVKVILDQWSKTLDLQTTFQDISAVRVRWLQYTTASVNHRTIDILCEELKPNGITPKEDASNSRYFLTLPIDPGFPVTCTYGNIQGDYDQLYDVPFNTNQLTFKVLIDERPAITDVTEANPVVFEIAFYKLA
jgi:hypothetical protein